MRTKQNFNHTLFAPPPAEPRYPFTLEWPDGISDKITCEADGWQAIEKRRIRLQISQMELLRLAMELGGVLAIEPRANEVDFDFSQAELMPAPVNWRYE